MNKIEQLNEEQRVIVDDLIPKLTKLLSNSTYKDVKLEDRMFTITSGAGCGKSFTTSILIQELDKLGYYMRACTPTHKSLAVLDEMIEQTGTSVASSTIHSYLGLKVKEDHNTGKYILEQEYGSNPPENVDILWVDEASMVSEDLFEYIKAELQYNTIKIAIFVSDKYQLPPVEGKEFPLYSNDKITAYTLHNIVRQAEGSNIIKLATKIRESIMSGNYLSNIEIKEIIQECKSEDVVIVKNEKELLERYYLSDYPAQSNLVVAYKNATVSKYNKKIRNTLINAEECFVRGESLVFNEAHFDNADICVHRNNETIEIKHLEKIRETSLDLYYWKVIDTKDRVFRAVDFNELTDYEYELSELAKKAKKGSPLEKKALWQQFFTLKKTFQNVAYTYAFTSHRTQGSSCNECFILLDEIIGMRNIIGDETMLRSLYVALTRPKQRLIIMMK